MQIPFILITAVVATFTTALPTNKASEQQLSKRNPVCGYFFDNYLGDSTGGYVYGDNVDPDRGCQNLRKEGENPNYDSTYTVVLDNPQCQYCKVYS
jgi:hypothetical protein